MWDFAGVILESKAFRVFSHFIVCSPHPFLLPFSLSEKTRDSLRWLCSDAVLLRRLALLLRFPFLFSKKRNQSQARGIPQMTVRIIVDDGDGVMAVLFWSAVRFLPNAADLR